MSKNGIWKKIRPNLDLYLFALPGIVITFIFSYIPIYGVQIAFRNYMPKRGFWGSPWVGLDNLMRFFNSAYFWDIIWNTVSVSLYSLIAGFPLPILLALMLNSFRHKRFGKVIQSVTYAPNFISTVVMAGMVVLFLSPRIGVINTILMQFGFDAVNFMAKPEAWRHIYVWSGIWQSTGFASVIYFAALSGVSPEYQEAAIVDGASKFQRVLHIDLPFLIPTAVILLILNSGGIMSVGFEKTFLLQNQLNTSVSEVISTYTYKQGIVASDLSYSTAIGLFNSVINSLILITVNWIAGKTSENSLW